MPREALGTRGPGAIWPRLLKVREVNNCDPTGFGLLARGRRPTASICLLKHKVFYILPTAILDEKMPGRKSITLPQLLDLSPIACNYGKIREAVAKAAA